MSMNISFVVIALERNKKDTISYGIYISQFSDDIFCILYFGKCLFNIYLLQDKSYLQFLPEKSHSKQRHL